VDSVGNHWGNVGWVDSKRTIFDLNGHHLN
jgi:hypothetical protein